MAEGNHASRVRDVCECGWCGVCVCGMCAYEGGAGRSKPALVTAGASGPPPPPYPSGVNKVRSNKQATRQTECLAQHYWYVRVASLVWANSRARALVAVAGAGAACGLGRDGALALGSVVRVCARFYDGVEEIGRESEVTLSPDVD